MSSSFHDLLSLRCFSPKQTEYPRDVLLLLTVILFIVVKQIHFVSQSPNLTRFKSFLQYLTLHVSTDFKYFPLMSTSKLLNNVDLIGDVIE